jgi:hypothetical protein
MSAPARVKSNFFAKRPRAPPMVETVRGLRPASTTTKKKKKAKLAVEKVPDTKCSHCEQVNPHLVPVEPNDARDAPDERDDVLQLTMKHADSTVPFKRAKCEVNSCTATGFCTLGCYMMHIYAKHPNFDTAVCQCGKEFAYDDASPYRTGGTFERCSCACMAGRVWQADDDHPVDDHYGAMMSVVSTIDFARNVLRIDTTGLVDLPLIHSMLMKALDERVYEKSLVLVNSVERHIHPSRVAANGGGRLFAILHPRYCASTFMSPHDADVMKLVSGIGFAVGYLYARILRFKEVYTRTPGRDLVVQAMNGEMQTLSVAFTGIVPMTQQCQRVYDDYEVRRKRGTELCARIVDLVRTVREAPASSQAVVAELSELVKDASTATVMAWMCPTVMNNKLSNTKLWLETDPLWVLQVKPCRVCTVLFSYRPVVMHDEWTQWAAHSVGGANVRPCKLLCTDVPQCNIGYTCSRACFSSHRTAAHPSVAVAPSAAAAVAVAARA